MTSYQLISATSVRQLRDFQRRYEISGCRRYDDGVIVVSLRRPSRTLHLVIDPLIPGHLGWVSSHRSAGWAYRAFKNGTLTQPPRTDMAEPDIEPYDQDKGRPSFKLVDYPTFTPTLETPGERVAIRKWWRRYHDFCWPCEECGECHHPDHENFCPEEGRDGG